MKGKTLKYCQGKLWYINQMNHEIKQTLGAQEFGFVPFEMIESNKMEHV